MKFQEDHPNNVLLEVMNPSDNALHNHKCYQSQCFYFLIQCSLFPAFIFSAQIDIYYTERRDLMLDTGQMLCRWEAHPLAVGIKTVFC